MYKANAPLGRLFALRADGDMGLLAGRKGGDHAALITFRRCRVAKALIMCLHCVGDMYVLFLELGDRP